ncbi:MAG: (5-formylfuran-3-yl)methyl phosphate synthase [Pirellulales bacterium]
MTGLLVSVRDVTEALAALEGGADWIDVKEPSRGALGRADVDEMARVVEAIAGRRPVSAALGELDAQTKHVVAQLPSGLEIVKVGLAGCEPRHGWRDELGAVSNALPVGIGLAAVVYADWQRTAAPSPRAVLDVAQETCCQTLLIDTFDKSGSNSLDHWSRNEWTAIGDAVRRAGLRLVLAGSLTVEMFDRALELSPDLIAVRGAACRGGREGRIDVDRVRALASALEARRVTADLGCRAVTR